MAAEKSGLKFLADENMSPVLVQILRKLGAGFVESMHSKPEKGSADEHWIPLYASRGYVIISPDRKQLRTAHIADVISESGARAIYLPSKFADSKPWDQALWLLRHWWKMF
ncbi:MAG TPA: hypothetical protein VGL56_10620 [Fimbriimonadaceae bacterium]|jgi:hypothetical protein